MRKVALVFVIAVLLPSLLLAWLAIRSLRDQQFLLERQQSLLYQGVSDAVAAQVQNALATYQSSFALETTKLLQQSPTGSVSSSFDDQLRKRWPLAKVGFVVTLQGEVLNPSPFQRPEARKFLEDNGRFLGNREAAEVYLNTKGGFNNAMVNNYATADQSSFVEQRSEPAQRWQPLKPSARNVQPQQAAPAQILQGQQELPQQFSKLAASEAEFRQLIGEETEGTVARFVDNKLNVLFWCRPAGASLTQPVAQAQQQAFAPSGQLVYGAQLDLARALPNLVPLVRQVEPALLQDICIALLDDTGKPAAVSHPSFQAHWKRPLVATEIGEVLPHWEVAVYLLNPAKLTHSAQVIRLTLGLLIAVLLLAIAVGGWLLVADVNRQLSLARQKTDFVSNVSHELKTPLTSIRMFSELLAEGRVADPGRQRAYLGIITAEAARLTRLINNVLDFAKLERGEKKYRMQRCDLVEIVREAAETFRPHLESNGFEFQYQVPQSGVAVSGDRDALAQVVLNLLSNAEKYSGTSKEIELRLLGHENPLPHAEVQVLDRGLGVPAGCEEKIFEKFYRAHDSLSSGIQGSGLGLTLARQIARAHGGEVLFERRDGGGSCFSLRLPTLPQTESTPTL